MKIKIFGLVALLGALVLQPLYADSISETFKELDVNGDGYISEKEASAHNELPDAFEEGDENGDGKLDINEFTAMDIVGAD